MQTQTQTPTSSSKSSKASTREISVQNEGITPSDIRSVLMSDGYHNVSNCSFVQFAIGEAHSPITPSRTYPYLKFQDLSNGGNWVYCPINQILGVSTSESSPVSLRSTSSR